MPLAVALVPGLIDVESRLLGQVVEQFLVGPLQGPADLADDLGQLAARDRQADDVAEELADGREGGVAAPLEIGDQCGQPRPGQATALDRQGERGVMLLAAVRAPSRMSAVLVDLQGYRGDVNPLDDDRLGVVGQEQVTAAAGAGVQEVVGGLRSEHLGRERHPLVRGVSRLAAGLAPRLTGWRLRLGGLDDVGGRRLGRVGGVLEGRGQLLLQLLDGGLESDELSAQGVNFGLQPLAIGTRRHCFGIHGRRIYTTCARRSTL